MLLSTPAIPAFLGNTARYGWLALLAVIVAGATSGCAGLPKDVTDKLAKALADIVADPAIVKRFEELGITTVKMSSGEFAGFVVKQINDWAPAIKAADVKN